MIIKNSWYHCYQLKIQSAWNQKINLWYARKLLSLSNSVITFGTINQTKNHGFCRKVSLTFGTIKKVILPFETHLIVVGPKKSLVPLSNSVITTEIIK